MKSFALTLTAPHGLHGLHAFFAAQGLHGLHAFFAAQGLHGLHAFFAAHGLHGLHAFFAAHGLQGLHALAITMPRLVAHGFAELAVTAKSGGTDKLTMPPKIAAHSGFRLTGIGFRDVDMYFST